MDISPEGDAVAISLEGGNVHVFDMKNGRERLKLKTTDDEMSMAVRYSPNGRHLLTTSGYSEGLIRIWDAQDGRSLGNLAGHRTYVTDLVFTPDGRELFSASGDYTIRIWDWAERRSVGVLHGHSDEVWCLALSPDGRALASRGKDGAIHLWDLSRSRKRHEFRLLPNTAGDASAKLWDNDKTFTFAEHSQIILANSFPESEQAHSRLVAWDVATLRRTPLPFENPSILSPDGRQIASFAPIAGDPPQQKVMVSNIRGQILTNFTLPGTLSSLISWVSYSADGQLLVEARAPPSSRAETATALCSVSSTDSWQHRQFAHKIRPGDQFSRLCGLASSNWFALVGDAVVVVFDVTRPDLPSKRITFTSRPRVVFSDVAVSSDGKSIATSSEDGYLTVWDWETLAVKWQTRAFLQGAHSVAFSSDGLRLAAGSNASEAVKLWDTATGQELVTLRGEGSRFIGLKFSPDGQHLLGVNAKGAAHLWSAPSWEEITTAAAKERPHSQPHTPK
jgi:WD40 repeat protein